MGVPGLTSWLTACYGQSVRHAPPRVHHILVDLPAMVHGLLRTAVHVAFLVRCALPPRLSSSPPSALHEALDALVLRYQPHTSLVLALDGVAALAKLLVQRRRRVAVHRVFLVSRLFLRRPWGPLRALLALTPPASSEPLPENLRVPFLARRLLRV